MSDDLIIPELTGFDVLDQLRADEQTRNLPVIVVSSKSLTAQEVAYLQEHATAVLSKVSFADEGAARRIEILLDEALLQSADVHDKQ